MAKIVPVYAIQELILCGEIVADTPFDAHNAADDFACECPDDFEEVHDLHGGISCEYVWRPVKFTPEQKARYTEILHTAYLTYIASHISEHAIWDKVNLFSHIAEKDAFSRFTNLAKNKDFKAILKKMHVPLWMSLKNFEIDIFKDNDYQETLRYVPLSMHEDFINLAFASIPDASDEDLRKFDSDDEWDDDDTQDEDEEE